jgi:hypothetical protein
MLCDMGQIAGFVLRYGTKHITKAKKPRKVLRWDHSAGFNYALWALLQDTVQLGCASFAKKISLQSELK